MRRKIALYIADQLVDLDDQSFILFNHTMEDLSNPTIVRNSFSKQVTLPGTPNNNKIFGGIFKLDRETQYSASYSGVNFDASRKTPFMIFDELNGVIESGYMRLDEVTRSKGRVSYKISLYGGLGSFFYGLMYNDDGSKKTLADMRYDTINGVTTSPGRFGQIGGYAMLRDCWTYMSDPEGYEQRLTEGTVDCPWCNILNFAPAYNGLPDGFSADKAVINSSYVDLLGNFGYENVPNTVSIQKDNGEGGTTPVSFTFKSGTSSNLMVMNSAHTEWEMKDLRWYLQRPVVRVKSIINAICDSAYNGGYSVNLSDEFFVSTNELYENAWITLPLIPVEERQSEDALYNLLGGTISPAEYLISFAKMFGLVFLYDRATSEVSILTRKEFYEEYHNDIIDLTARIDSSNITITPVLAQTKFYQFGKEVIGEWATAYKEEFGKDYAAQMVNTGNDFNAETTYVTEGIQFQDAVEVQERDLLFSDIILPGDEGGAGRLDYFLLPLYETVKLHLWGTLPGDSEQSMEEIDIICYPFDRFRYFFNPDYPLSDWLPKVQFHDKDNKAIDGSNVLLVFNGIEQTPYWSSNANLRYRLTDDIPDMAALNEGMPCWNFTSVNSQWCTWLPSFRRNHITDDVIDATFEWGVPAARGVNGVTGDAGATIYSKWWIDYQSDRFDDDTFVMRCKVNLQGMQVGQDLMRRFFYYQGAIFVLNKISNHSLTTWDDTECEFIKVQDINNYIS